MRFLYRTFAALLLLALSIQAADHLWVCVKLGDQQNAIQYRHRAMKDGMIIDYVDPDDPNYGEKWFPAPGARRVFLWLKVSDSYKNNIINWLQPEGDPTDTVNYRARKRLVRLGNLPASIQTKIRNKLDSTKVIDLTDIQAALLSPDGSKVVHPTLTTAQFISYVKASDTLNPPAVDENLISAGSASIGSGETYASISAFISDLANLTGDLTGTVTSAITDNGAAQLTEDLGTYTLTITSDSDHGGDPTAGHLWSLNGTNTGIDFLGAGSAGCKFILEKLNMKRTGASGNDITLQSSDADVEVVVRDLLMDGNGVSTRGIWITTNQATRYIYNCNIWDVVNFGLQFPASFTGQVENVTVYSCNSHGYYIAGVAVTLKNCIGYDNAGDEFYQPASATCTNCAWDGTGAIGFGTESGTVDEIVDGDFLSVTDTESDFLAIDASSDLFRAGTDGTISGHTTSINGVTWASGNWDVGAFGVDLAIVLDSIIPDSSSTNGGDTVVLYGSYMDSLSEVKIGDSTATIISKVADSALVEVTGYAAADTLDVIVTGAEGTKDTIENGFWYYSAFEFTLDSIVPDSGNIDSIDTVIVYGTGMDSLNTITGGDSTWTIISKASDSAVVQVTGYGAAGAVDVIGTGAVGLKDTLSSGFTYYEIIVFEVDSIVPDSGSLSGGDRAVIYGGGLTDLSTVTCGDNTWTIVTAYADSAILTIAANSDSGVYSVIVESATADVDSISDGFKYFFPPVFLNNHYLDNPGAQGSREWFDTVYIDGTGSDTTEVYWQDDGAQKYVMFCPSDDSTDGWSDDSACVSIELLQAIPSRGEVGFAPSRANPDSLYWDYSDDFILSDSLSIASMDTLSVRYLDTVIVRTGGRYDTTFRFNDQILGASDSTFPFEYYVLQPDYTPGIAFKLTGKANNASRGTGSRWIVKIGQLLGGKVR